MTSELSKQYDPKITETKWQQYWENQEPIPDIYGLELLKFILEERNLQKQDLLSIFESKSTLDDIFDGLQELTPIYIQKLANFLNISPDLFFPS